MTLNPGAKIGAYEILVPLGAGGMGVVYLARDTRLDRSVAIKTLPGHLVTDADRLARFEREAKIVASLNHSGIAAVYALEDHDGKKYLVMEYVEGQTLAARLMHGPLPPDEAIDIAIQIAGALEAAHEKSVVHRDLKPGNVMLTSAGKVKVLDFGLARTNDSIAAADSSRPVDVNSPTMSLASPAYTDSPTIPGAILGTAGYMSPEQARGKPVDKRSDIFSFGCILYEMLAGAQPFGGDTVADSIGAILHKEADLSRLSPDTPPEVRRVLTRCLAKDKGHRLHDIADARIELESIGVESVQIPPTRSTAARKFATFGAFVGGAFLVALVMSIWNRPGSSSPAPVTRFAVTQTRMPNDAFVGIAISPDGRQIVYRAVAEDGVEDLRIRSLDTMEARPLSDGAEGGWLPFFSPDGGRVGFFTRGVLKCVTLASRITRNIVMIDQGGYSGATWLPDDTIIFAGSSNKFGRVHSTGGPIENLEVKGLREGEYVITPWALPDGETILCGVVSGSVNHIGVYNRSDHSLNKIVENGFSPIYAESGHILYRLGTGPLTAAPFDLTRREVTGAAFPVISDLGIGAGYQVRLYTVSANGTLAYVPKSTSSELGALMWVDRQGKSEPITNIDRVADIPRLSHDGLHIAFRIPAPNCDIWVHDLQRGVNTRLTREGDNHGIAWSGDDKHLLFARLNAPQLWSVMAAAVDGSGKVEEWTPAATPRGFVTSVSRDGQFVLLNSTNENGEDVFLARIADKKVAPMLNSRYHERAAVFSPNGASIAYVSDESGREEIYVQPFPSLDVREQISTNGGTDPVWSRDGKELFFRSGNKMMVVGVSMEPSFSAGRPQTLFETDLTSRGNSGLAGFDISSDGQRFVMVRQRAGEGGVNVNVVLNWFEELRTLSPKVAN